MSGVSLRDPGLQPERTALSWHRTGWLILLNAVLAVRTAVSNDSLGLTMMAFVLLPASSAVFLLGAHRRRALLEYQTPSCVSAAGMLGLAVLVFVVAGVGFAGIALAALRK